MRRLSLNQLVAGQKSGQNIPKNRCRTTIPERMVETPAELPFIGDQVSRPAESHRRALAGRVEDWRAGIGRCRATFPAPSTSNAACGFPALRSPICFTSRLIGPILPGRLSACRVALDSREQPESVVQPRPTPSFPAEALSLLSMRQLAPDLLLHPILDEAEALTGVPNREVVHPSS